MGKRLWVIVAFLAALFAGMLVWGMHKGEPNLVLQNAQNLCFS